jgi:hypothetical protein
MEPTKDSDTACCELCARERLYRNLTERDGKPTCTDELDCRQAVMRRRARYTLVAYQSEESVGSGSTPAFRVHENLTTEDAVARLVELEDFSSHEHTNGVDEWGCALVETGTLDDPDDPENWARYERVQDIFKRAREHAKIAKADREVREKAARAAAEAKAQADAAAKKEAEERATLARLKVKYEGGGSC